MMAALLLRRAPRWPRSALLIGLGAASLPKFLYRHYPQAKLQVVETEPGVVATARQCFRLPEDARRMAIEIGDGDDYVGRSERVFDLILVDGFDASGRPVATDLLRDVKQALLERRTLVLTLLGGSLLCYGSGAHPRSLR